jgi:hypothetical protein
MTGSVRGALSNERPYRDRASPILAPEQHLARRAHVFDGRGDRVGTARERGEMLEQ